MTDIEYRYTTADLAKEFGITTKTFRKRAHALGLGIDLAGRAGFRYSESDRQRLIESLRPSAPVKAKRNRRRAA